MFWKAKFLPYLSAYHQKSKNCKAKSVLNFGMWVELGRQLNI